MEKTTIKFMVDIDKEEVTFYFNEKELKELVADSIEAGQENYLGKNISLILSSVIGKIGKEHKLDILKYKPIVKMVG